MCHAPSVAQREQMSILTRTFAFEMRDGRVSRHHDGMRVIRAAVPHLAARHALHDVTPTRDGGEWEAHSYALRNHREVERDFHRERYTKPA